MTYVMGSTLALRFPALPDAAAPAPASQQDARVPLPAYGVDYDVFMDLTVVFAGIIDVSKEEARLRAQAWRFEQTFEARAEQHSFEQRDRALRQTVREEFDGYRAHLAMEMQEDIPAHVGARIDDVCDFQVAVQRRCPPVGTACWRAL